METLKLSDQITLTAQEIQTWPRQNRDDLIVRLGELTGEMCRLKVEYGFLVCEAKRLRLSGYMASEANSVAGRERAAEAAALQAANAATEVSSLLECLRVAVEYAYAILWGAKQ